MNKDWMPEKGVKYYFVDSSLGVDTATCCDISFDVARRYTGNCFKTRGEAIEVAEKIRELFNEEK